MRSVICSDIAPDCRKFLCAVHKPIRLYNGVEKRGFADRKLDLYTAGFPCQPWSSEGKGEGRQDKLGRGKVFDHISRYIDRAQPTVFCLENVSALTHSQHKDAFNAILETLRKSGLYFVTWRVLNSSDFGLPQSRHRLFIVGLLRAKMNPRFTGFPWPKPRSRMPLPLERFLCGGKGILKRTWPKKSVIAKQIKNAEARIRAAGGDPSKKMYAVDANSGCGAPNMMCDRVPCLTRTRAACGGYFLTREDLRRFHCVEEMLNLQGLPVTFRAQACRAGITDRQLAQMVGNAIPTNILMILLARMLTVVDLQGSQRELRTLQHTRCGPPQHTRCV